ncbi:MAG: hypothetical protein M0R46_13220 [Candidatus Muirbacterium halophilum]|nr:hypothetical protein [Candidatus Muirbacterium halophilum]
MNCYINNVKQDIKIRYTSKYINLPYRCKHKLSYNGKYKLNIKTNKEFYIKNILNKDNIYLDIEVENLRELNSYIPNNILYISSENNKYYTIIFKLNRTTITSTYKDVIDIIIICDIIDITELPLQKIRDCKLSNIW